MSFIDLVGILLITSLCYIGYSKGLKGKLFFLVSFFTSAFLMYFGFDYILHVFQKPFKSILLAGIFVSVLIVIPMFLLIEFSVKKLFAEESKSFSANKNKITNTSRFLGAIVGFIGGYIFMFYVISISKTDFLDKSYFYKVHKDQPKIEAETANSTESKDINVEGEK